MSYENGDNMMNEKSITRRPYRYLTDFEDVYRFMRDNYSIDGAYGQKPPFFEYAQALLDFDRVHTYLDAIWEDAGGIVAFCYYEINPGQAYFNLKKGYECLIPEMITYAEQNMKSVEGKLICNIYSTQTAFADELRKRGYKKTEAYPVHIYDLSKPLIHPLPEGFRFVSGNELDLMSLTRMIWRAFGNDEWANKDATGAYMQHASPHQTKSLDVVIAASNGDYACFAGMWLVPEVHLAYLEPLCTAPEYRRRGLASAALSELSRRTIKLGATHMTGGAIPFYKKIGYDAMSYTELWEKERC